MAISSWSQVTLRVNRAFSYLGLTSQILPGFQKVLPQTKQGDKEQECVAFRRVIVTTVDGMGALKRIKRPNLLLGQETGSLLHISEYLDC